MSDAEAGSAALAQRDSVAVVTLESVAAGTGDAVARLDGFAVFVDDGLPGDVVEIKITERRKRFARGTMLRVVTPSPSAIAPGCKQEHECGGCRFQRASYLDELQWKSTATVESLRRIAPNVVWPEATVIADSKASGYRERTKMRTVPGGGSGYVAHRSHRLVAIDHCAVLHPAISAAREEASAFAGRLPTAETLMLEYDEVREQVAVTIGLRAPLSPAALERARRDARDVTLAISTVVLEVERTRIALTGDGLVLRSFGVENKVDVRCLSGGFSQANGRMNPTLVATTMAAASGARRVLELFSGAGNLTFPLLEKASFVCAIEGAEPAIRAAEQAWRKQGDMARARFVSADLATGIPPAHRTSYDTIVADPPRGGMRGCIPHIGAGEAKRLVYVSCDPAAMARDCGELASHGFRVESLTLIDMFPRTHHFEAVARLVR